MFRIRNRNFCLRGKKRDLYLPHVFRKKLDYPALKRAVVEQAQLWGAKTVIIEDKASGTQLIQELVLEGFRGIHRYEPPAGTDKVMRMHSCTSTIENGFVYIPEKAEWLPLYLHELKVFPNGKNDDQVDATSQALDWVKQRYMGPGIWWWLKWEYDKAVARGDVEPNPELEDMSF